MPVNNNMNDEVITRKHVRKIIYPIIIGLAVVVYLLQREVDVDLFAIITFTWYSVFWLAIAFLMMVIRDVGYIVRLKILSEGDFTLRQCFNIIMLWELRGPWGWSIFGVIWGLAVAGVIFKLFFYKDKYRLLSAIIYVVMGWIIIIALDPLIRNVPSGGLYWLFAGAIFYSSGVFFYIRRKNRFNHVIWHLFVLAGSISHFFAIFYHVLPH